MLFRGLGRGQCARARALVEGLAELAGVTTVGMPGMADGAAWLRDPANDWTSRSDPAPRHRRLRYRVRQSVLKRHAAPARRRLDRDGRSMARDRCRALGADAVFDRATQISELMDFCTAQSEAQALAAASVSRPRRRARASCASRRQRSHPEGRHLQHQRHQEPVCRACWMARARTARCRMPAGAEGAGQRFPEAELKQLGYHSAVEGTAFVEWRRDPGEGREAGGGRRECPGTLRTSTPLSRSGYDGVIVACLTCRMATAAGTQVRLQAPGSTAHRHAAGLYRSGHPVVIGGRLQRGADRLRHLQPEVWRKTQCCSLKPRELPAPAGAGGSIRSAT